MKTTLFLRVTLTGVSLASTLHSPVNWQLSDLEQNKQPKQYWITPDAQNSGHGHVPEKDFPTDDLRTRNMVFLSGAISASMYQEAEALL